MSRSVRTANQPANTANQANLSFIIGQLKKLLPKVLTGVVEIDALDALIALAYKTRSQIQPGRSCKRRNQKGVRRTKFNYRKAVF